jgi:hypothetical protein
VTEEDRELCPDAPSVGLGASPSKIYIVYADIHRLVFSKTTAIIMGECCNLDLHSQQRK